MVIKKALNRNSIQINNEYKILINKLQDLRVHARDIDNFDDLKNIKKEIEKYQSILNSLEKFDIDFISSL